MPSNSSSKALVLRDFFNGSSSSIKKPSPKSSGSKPSGPKHSGSQGQYLKAEAYDEENKSVWKAVKSRNGNLNTLIMAVVPPEQKRPMQKMIEEKKKENKIQSTVVVATQKHLQDAITTTLNKANKTFYLFVSSSIRCITYDIPKIVKDVHVAPCQPCGRPDALRIGSSSRYCQVKAYAWNRRDPKLCSSGYQITHAEGCYFDFSDDMDAAQRIFQQPTIAPEVSPEEQDAIMQQFRELPEGDQSGPNTGIPVSSNAAASSQRHAEDTGSWFQKSKGLIALMVGAGSGVAAMAGTFWITGGGIYLQGPLGLSVACGYWSAGIVGGACAAGAGTAIAAAAAVYFIPWGSLWEYLKRKLWQVWEKIQKFLSWIWEKMKALGRGVVSMFTGWDS